MPHDRGEVERTRFQLQLPGLEPSDEEQVVHEVKQTVGVAIDHIEIPTLLLGEVAVLECELEITDDRRQRRSEIVGDERDEFVLDPARFEQLLVLQRELTPGGLRLCTGSHLSAPKTVERPDQTGEPQENQVGRSVVMGRNRSTGSLGSAFATSSGPPG